MQDKYPLLGQINSPHDLHGLGEEDLAGLAQEIREYIIDTVGEVGGHFGSNLGVCELAVALHSLLDSPRDKILWDVGHQAYPHKILTGRRDQLPTIRKYGGLSGFLSRSESEHDIMGAGHASTSISYAVGLMEAMRLAGSNYEDEPQFESEDRPRGSDRPESAGRVVCVTGDGAMTGGVAFEALNHAGHLQTPIVVILNDNEMSISPNVGAVSRHFQNIRLKHRLYRAREGVEELLKKLPAGVGDRIGQVGPQVKEAIKAFYAPGLIYEELDFAYVGVIDGHDIHALRQAISKALDAKRPVLVHVKTVKGKGFAPSEKGGYEGMEAWHAAKPESIVNRKPVKVKPLKKDGPPSWTEVFGKGLVAEAHRDPRVVGITAAMAGGTGLSYLAVEIPDRYYDVGIAEQHAVLLAAGLAVGGMKPIAAIYSTFLQRAYDQIVHDVALQKLNVVFAMDRAGLVGDDGPTHHGAFDVSYLRLIPNMVIMAPSDEAMLLRMLRTSLLYNEGPIAFRYPRGSAKGVDLPADPRPVDIGRGVVLEAGDRVALVGLGTGVGICGNAADLLARRHGIAPTVVDARFAKPLDITLLEELADTHELLVTVEENTLFGGFGAGVMEALDGRSRMPRIVRCGIPDRYITHGNCDLLLEEVGLTGEQVAERVAASLGSGAGLGEIASSRSKA